MGCWFYSYPDTGTGTRDPVWEAAHSLGAGSVQTSGRSVMAESGEGVQAGRRQQQSSPGVLPALSNHPLLSSDFTWPKQGLHASAALSLRGWTWSPRSEVAGAVGSRCGSRGPRRLIRGWVDVGTGQWGRVEGHGHGGSHSGEALGQGGGQPPPEPSCSWSWGPQGLGALFVHLHHLGRDTGP